MRAYTRSPGPTSRSVAPERAANSRFECDSITPFGAPVVPEV